MTPHARCGAASQIERAVDMRSINPYAAGAGLRRLSCRQRHGRSFVHEQGSSNTVSTRTREEPASGGVRSVGRSTWLPCRMSGRTRCRGCAARWAPVVDIDRISDRFTWVPHGRRDRLERGYALPSHNLARRWGALASATYRFPSCANQPAGVVADVQETSTAASSTRSRVRWNTGNLPSDDPALATDYYSNVGGERAA